MTEKEIRLEFTLSEAEFVAFQREHGRHGWRRWILPGMFCVIALAVSPPLLQAIRLGDRPGMIGSAVALVLFTLVFVIVAPLTQRSVFRRIYRRQPGIQRPQRFIVSESGIVNETDLGRGESRWPAFTELVELPSSYFVKFGPMLGYIVLKRAFETPAAEEHFRSFVERSVAGAKATAPAAPKA